MTINTQEGNGEKKDKIMMISIVYSLFQEKILRLERLGNTTQDPPSTRPTGQESYTLHARNPDADSLSTTYLYLALLVLIIGIIMGKFVF